MDELKNQLQDAIDRLIRAAHQAIPASDEDIHILRNNWGDIFSRTDYVTSGIPFGIIQSRLNDNDLAVSQVIDIEEISNEQRIDHARERLASEASDFDADYCPGFRAGSIRSTEGIDALVVFSVTGYSFSKIDVSFEGVHTSEEKFRERARGLGYFLADEIGSANDTKALVTDQEILDRWEK